MQPKATQWEVVRNDGLLIRYIKDRSEEVQLAVQDYLLVYNIIIE